MRIRGWSQSLTIAVLLALAIPLAVNTPGAYADGDEDQFTPPERDELNHPNLETMLNDMVDSVQREGALEEDAAMAAPVHSEESVAVTIHLSGHVDDVVSFLEDNGGDPRNVGEDYIEAYVPVSVLGTLSEQPGVQRVESIVPPHPAQAPPTVAGHGPSVHGSPAWNESGFTGQGVKIGVVDLGFRGFSDLMGTELPETVKWRCYTLIGMVSEDLADCEQDTVHGTAVAEAVMDVAPEATLYITNPYSDGDLRDAVDWLVSEGVSVINFSVGASFDGPGDGTSPISVSPLNTVDHAVDGGILWVNAAGNAATDTWFGEYSDSDGDGVVDFDGSDEGNGLNLFSGPDAVVVQLRWEDVWGGATSDLDLYLINDETRRVVDRSVSPQSGGAAQVPYERMVAIVDGETSYSLVVDHYEGPAPDWIQVTTWGVRSLEHYSENGSITNPAESANPGLLAVGAAPYFDVHNIEFFSSRGPTPDGRIKPDIVGADCGETATYSEFPYLQGQSCWFPGTSQASPHVAGMAVLVKQRFPDYTPVQVADYLKRYAEQRDEPDSNNTWGHGFAQLWPIVSCFQMLGPLTNSINQDDVWTPDCDSANRSGRYARFYSFTLDQQTDVQIDLTSSEDTYMYLLQGDGTDGAVMADNDDVDDGSGSTNSRITRTLEAGAYTVEATTYSVELTGSFIMTVSDLNAGTPTPEPTPTPTPTDECGDNVTADGTFNGEWAEGCDSQARDGRYARFYNFTLDAEGEVIVTLESDEADTYLYLREGEARSGDFLHENDDHEGSTAMSRIQETLAAGTYTIEATTYDSDETGNFTLTITGLSTAAEPPPEQTTPQSADNCGETVTDDGASAGEWAEGCDSETRGGSHARFYSFTLEAEGEVTITLESSEADPYLYLREGEARSGEVLHENDDIEAGVNTNSRIVATLVAGTYTIEATTYGEGETGAFTVTIAGQGTGDDTS